MTHQIQFYLVGSDGAATGARIDPACDLSIAGAFSDFKGQTPPTCVRFVVRGGRREDDFVVSGLVPITLVSSDLLQSFEGAGITGFSTYKIELERRKGWPRKDYAGLRINGRCGPIDNSRSPRVPRISPHSGLRSDVYMGLYFEKASWAGSDLFVPSDESAYLFATERVKEAAERSHLKGIQFQPIEKVERFML